MYSYLDFPGYPDYPDYPGYPGYPDYPGYPGYPGDPTVIQTAVATPLAPPLAPPWASAGGPIQPADLREVCFVRDLVRTPTSPPPRPVTNEARLAKSWERRRSSALRQLTLVLGAAPRGSGPSKGSTVTWSQGSTDAIAPSCHMRAAAAQPRLSPPRCLIPR